MSIRGISRVPDGFTVVCITMPQFYEGEATDICTALQSGYDYVHIRKPGYPSGDIERLIRAIDPSLHSRLRLHDCHELAAKYHIAGVHLNARNPLPPADVTEVTRSCHSLRELECPVPDGCVMPYQFLSPIFDSISKPGYQSAFNESDLRDGLSRYNNIIALGGVTPDNFVWLKEIGFAGAAMLGAVWDVPS